MRMFWRIRGQVLNAGVPVVSNQHGPIAKTSRDGSVSFCATQQAKFWSFSRKRDWKWDWETLAAPKCPVARVVALFKASRALYEIVCKPFLLLP